MWNERFRICDIPALLCLGYLMSVEVRENIIGDSKLNGITIFREIAI
jgi:hypothetical protein